MEWFAIVCSFLLGAASVLWLGTSTGGGVVSTDSSSTESSIAKKERKQKKAPQLKTLAQSKKKKKNDKKTKADEVKDLAPPEERPVTAERRFYLMWRHMSNPRPAPKEVAESFAFFKASADLLTKPLRKSGKRVCVVDCCCGHGLIGMLFVMYGKAQDAVFVDLLEPDSHAHLLRAAREHAFIPASASCEFVLGDLRQTLAGTLQDIIESGRQPVVVACHACAFLTHGIADICCDAVEGSGQCVPFASMSCCHKDPTQQVQNACAHNNLSLGVGMDLVMTGRLLERGLSVRWKHIDASITPQNRVLIVSADTRTKVQHAKVEKEVEEWHTKAERAYMAAHMVKKKKMKAKG